MRLRTLLSAVTLVGATLAPAVVAAAPSDAVPAGTWQRLANCESGGRWHLDSGNGYFGGLQISRGTWAGYGGGRFARYPNNASVGQQITIAQRIKNGQGWGAWPSCSRRIGVA